MNFVPQLTVPFNLDAPILPKLYSEGIRPTITVLLRDPSAQILLLLPKKAPTNASAFMFPQGPIAPRQTPRQALKERLQIECGYTSDIVNFEEAKALGISPVETNAAAVTKIHYIVFASLRRFRKPTLNEDDNRKWLFVHGPNNFWSKIYHCRPEKRRLMIAAVFKAMEDSLLLNTRWSKDRFSNIRGFGALSSS